MQGCEKFVLKCLSRKAQVDVFFKASKRTWYKRVQYQNMAQIAESAHSFEVPPAGADQFYSCLTGSRSERKQWEAGSTRTRVACLLSTDQKCGVVLCVCWLAYPCPSVEYVSKTPYFTFYCSRSW
jgi:(2Fe-2S) ferredoxin